MYKIASNCTQIKCDKNGPVKDEDGKQVMEPVGCLTGFFRWPPDGIVVPGDFFADDKAFVAMVKSPGIDLYMSEDGEEWRLLELEDEDEAGGPSPSARPAPSPDAAARAESLGIRVSAPTGRPPAGQPPQLAATGRPQEVSPEKVRAHLESMTSPPKKGRRGRKGKQQAMNG